MKLEDIKKKNIYSVPDKYFDQLPTRIQARVNDSKPAFKLSWRWNLLYKIAVPTLVIIFIVFYFGIESNNFESNADNLLAQVSSDDLIAYLETTDLTTDEIIEELDLSDLELDFYDEGPIMQDMNINEEEMNVLFDEYGIEGDIL